MIDEQPIEAPDVHADRERRQQPGEREQDRLQQPRVVVAAPAFEQARASAEKRKDDGHAADDHRHRGQPAGDQVPGGQREHVEGERLAEDRIVAAPAAAAGPSAAGEL